MNPSAMANQEPSFLATELQRHRPLYNKAIFFSLIINLLVLAPTLFMLEVYDRVVNSRSSTTLAMLLILVIGAYVVMELLELVRGGIMHEAATKMDAAVRMRLLNAVFAIRLRGGATNAVQPFSDLRAVRDFMSSPALMALLDAPASIVFLVLVFIISPWLGALALLGALVQLYIAVRTEKRTLPLLGEASRAAIAAQAYASGTLRNAQVIEAMGMQQSLHQRWAKTQREFLKLQADASDHNGTNTATSKLIQTLQGSLLLGAACWLSLKGGILGGGGMMIVASTLGARVLNPLTQLVAQWRLVINARQAYARLDKILDAFPDPPLTMPLPPPKGHLTVESVVAAAPGSSVPILKGVSFSAAPGEVVVIVGPSAAGKTTLARLLVGIWPAASGKVRLDGVDVYSWRKDELGPHIGYLPQSVELFDGSLAANIARFGDIDMAQVRAAAEQVGLGSMIEALADGYETRIGEDGSFLSGGQRQRVALARALYGNPQLVVLDEPNSSLDEAGEQALVGALAQLRRRGATVVVNTHRTNVLAAADKLLILRDGQVGLFGPRDEVLAAMQKAAGLPVPAGAVPSTAVVAAAGGAA